MSLLFLLVAATAFGWWVGGRSAVAPKARRYGHGVLLASIGVLLFSMGVSLGTRPEIVSQMALFGARAASLSLSGALGAILAVGLLRRFWRKRRA